VVVDVAATVSAVVVEIAGNKSFQSHNHAEGVRPVALEFEEFLEQTWPDQITFDREKANESGVIVFCWKQTLQPLPITFEISQATFGQGRVNRRELRNQIKENLPANLIKQCISEIFSLMRDANRKNLSKVSRMIDLWIQSTGQTLRKALGNQAAEEFLVRSSLPNHFQSGSIQALQYLVDQKVEILRNF
jgi:hypothetical protein